MHRIPFLLIYSRILLGIAIGVFAICKTSNFTTWIVLFMILGIITDIFDGIIARKLNVSSLKLRVWDSNVDQFFWLVTIASIFYLNLEFLKINYFWVGFVLLLEVIAYVVSYYKFGKSIATHSILAKIWTLTLLAFLIDLTLHSSSSTPFIICIGLGLISRVEIILIILSLYKWTSDVPSIFSVSNINKGIPIKRNKLFNG